MDCHPWLKLYDFILYLVFLFIDLVIKNLIISKLKCGKKLKCGENEPAKKYNLGFLKSEYIGKLILFM